ncbi:MAG: ATP-binding cassette domain-containing protein [Gammaproteobacteria bacterium]|nr:ATP-binding cassette domain-containing protein [Gammaproteobacteria bacterium]
MIENFRISFRDISKRYGSNPVLDQAAISIASHDCIVITGVNGAGKTTLLRIIAGLDKPNQCEVMIDDSRPEPWRRLRRRLLKSIMYLHQQPYMFAGSLLRNIQYAARLNPAVTDCVSSVKKAIHWAGLEGLENQSADSLSGGQKQRVALTRARLRHPQILLLDEPTANLDSESRQRTLQMLQEFRDSGTAIVIVTHDPEVFSELATGRLYLRDHQLLGDDAETHEVVNLESVRQSITR